MKSTDAKSASKVYSVSKHDFYLPCVGKILYVYVLLCNLVWYEIWFSSMNYKLQSWPIPLIIWLYFKIPHGKWFCNTYKNATKIICFIEMQHLCRTSLEVKHQEWSFQTVEKWFTTTIKTVHCLTLMMHVEKNFLAVSKIPSWAISPAINDEKPRIFLITNSLYFLRSQFITLDSNSLNHLSFKLYELSTSIKKLLLFRKINCLVAILLNISHIELSILLPSNHPQYKHLQKNS